MPERPNDRPIVGAQPIGDSDPRLVIIAGSEKFPRPGLETFFAQGTPRSESRPEAQTLCGCDPVVRTFCACNKVCRCVGACSCVGACGCVGHRSRCSCDSHSVRTGGCRCAPVH